MRTLQEMENNLALLNKEEIEIYGYSKLFKNGEMAVWIMDNWSYPELNNFIKQDIIYEYYDKRGCYIKERPVWLSDCHIVDVYSRLFSVLFLKKDFERQEYQVILQDIDDGTENYWFNMEYKELFDAFEALLNNGYVLDTKAFKKLVINNLSIIRN